MNNIKTLLFGAAMFGIGGIAGYFVCKKTLAAQYLEDIEDVQGFYYEKLRELGVQDEDFEPEHEFEGENSEPEEEKEDIQTTNYASYHRKKGVKPRIMSYGKPPLEDLIAEIEGEYTPSEDLEYEAELEARAEAFAKARAENRNNGLPYVITYDEFMEGPEEYERQALYYYLRDRVLCDDDDSIIDDEVVVGLDYEDVLDMQTICWVRNNQTTTLYEIHRINDSYEKAVQGVIETPREREFRIKGRQRAALDDDK